MQTPLPLQNWIGRSETVDDIITSTPYAALSATLDDSCVRPRDGVRLPPLWHWLYFLPLYPQSELGVDGHAQRGSFLPPVALPRRMWAGGQFRFDAPLLVGDKVRRTSTIADLQEKHGKSGPLTFVKVRHEIFREGEPTPAITEFHDIVYRENPNAGEVIRPTARIAPANAMWSREIVPDDVLLFRYSALTFNGHRIHYDRKYVTEVEGYPGLIVHGPLIATLLMELIRLNLPQRVVESFSFRAIRPAFDMHPFSVHGRLAEDGGTAQLWAKNHEHHLLMQAEAVLA